MRRVTRRVTATGACLLVAVLVVLLAVRYARALAELGTFGLPAESAAAFAAGVVALGVTAALLDRGHLPARVVGGLLATAGLLTGFLLLGGGDVAYEGYRPDAGPLVRDVARRDLVDQLTWLRGSVAVAALGLLPLAGAAAWRGGLRRVRLPAGARAVLLAVSAAAAVLLLRELERSVALLDLLRGDAQQLGEQPGLAWAVWVSALWALVAVAESARALRRPDVPLLAALLPPAVLLTWAALLLEDAPRHRCCFAYAPLDGSPLPEYVPPPVLPDLLLLGGCLLVGVVLPLVLQRLRVRTSASTPPG